MRLSAAVLGTAVLLLAGTLGSCGGQEEKASGGTATPMSADPGRVNTEVPTATPSPVPTPTPLPAGPGSVTGTIMFDRKPIAEVTAGQATFNVWNPETGVRPRFLTEYDPATAHFALTGIEPGDYSVFAWVDAAPPDGELFGGDYYSGLSGWSPEVSLSLEKPAAEANIPVVQIIHLTLPVDNSTSRTAVGDPPEPLPASAAETFVWDPVPGAARYTVRLLELETETGKALGGPFLDVSEHSVTFVPPPEPSAAGHHYGFSVEAYNADDELIAVFRHFYTNGDGGWFYFRAIADP